MSMEEQGFSTTTGLRHIPAPQDQGIPVAGGFVFVVVNACHFRIIIFRAVLGHTVGVVVRRQDDDRIL